VGEVGLVELHGASVAIPIPDCIGSSYAGHGGLPGVVGGALFDQRVPGDMD
jgi:hypothetical protein